MFSKDEQTKSPQEEATNVGTKRLPVFLTPTFVLGRQFARNQKKISREQTLPWPSFTSCYSWVDW